MPKKSIDKTKFLQILSEMSDEGFSWLLLACQKSAMMHGAGTQIWPDGLGGFSDREKIEELRAEAERLINVQ